jgi:hypothetical protein
LPLQSLDLDTGKPTAPAEYALADQTYARYLALLVSPRMPAPPPTPSALWPPPEPVNVQLAGAPQQAARAPDHSSGSTPAKAGTPAPTQTAPAAHTEQQPAPKPALQPISPAIRADVEHYFNHAAPGELLLKKQQWKALPKDLQTLRQLPTATPAPQANPPQANPGAAS